MEHATITNLFNKYINNECSPAEVDQLMNLLEQSGNESLKRELINRQLATDADLQASADPRLQEQLENRLQYILQQINSSQPAKLRSFSWMKVAAAAIFIVCIGGAAWLWLNRSQKLQGKQSAELVEDVPPGGNKAVLTLANGSTIVLDDAANGDLAHQGNAKVIKLNNGQLAYKPVGSGHSVVTYNVLSTPKGGQYQLVLPDGSKVWLNAASSIRFPTAFTGPERKVEITGEAYFEVKKAFDSRGNKISFAVNILPSTRGGREGAGGRVEVLGTHFNINAYDDEEAIKTTLLEGKVKVVNGEWSMVNGQPVLREVEGSAILKPGEQVSIFQSSQLSHPIQVQTEEVMAWKNGLFHFENADIKTVMRQLSRWYDVEVVYKKEVVKNEPLFIEFSRNKNLSDVLKAIELAAGIQLRIEGKKIIVL